MSHAFVEVQQAAKRPRSRAEIIKHPHFYTLRNYLTDFLINRSHTLRTSELDQRGLRYPKAVNPIAEEASSEDKPNPNPINFTLKEPHHG